MKETVHTITIAGRSWQYRYVEMVLPAFVLALRLAFGFYFIYAGLDKLFSGFSASGFLVHSSSGPLKDVFVDMGQRDRALDLIDPLVVYGQILIGGALIVGLFTRFALFMGAIQLFLFYLAQLWPANNPFLDDHIFDILTMALLGALGAGRIMGVDALIEKWQPFQRMRPLQYAMG